MHRSSPRRGPSLRPAGPRGGRTRAVAAAAAATLALVLAACGTGSGAAPRTITKVVTAAPTASTTTGGGITVVPPGNLGTGANSTGATSATGSTTASSTSAGSTTESTTATTATTTTLPPIPPDVANVLESGCPNLLTASDITAALGKSLPDKEIRILDVQNPGIGMTGGTRCYYGTDDLTVSKPLALALAAYATADAAQAQLEVTVHTEAGLGAQVADATVAGKPATVLLRDGGLIVTQVGTWTLSVALANGVVPAAQLTTALQKLATTARSHVG